MRKAGEDGFVLVATLFFVALLALVAVLIEGWVAASLDRASALKARISGQSALIGATDRIAYALLNSRLSPRGFELEPPEPVARSEAERVGFPPATASRSQGGPSVALDGRAYRVDAAIVRLQDDGGLYDINNANRETLDKLFKAYGLGAPLGDALVTALFDYAGNRGDIRAGGIRDADYAAAGLPLPRRAPLLSPWEPLRILRWQDAGAVWKGTPPIADMLTLGPVGGLNVNTAPVRVLAALTGMDEREAARLALTRAASPITDIQDVRAQTGGTGDENENRPLSLVPSNIIRLKVTGMGDLLMHVIGIRLTPIGSSPYRVDYAVALPPDGAEVGGLDAIPLPEAPAAAAPR